jgi:hypothetical protein
MIQKKESLSIEEASDQLRASGFETVTCLPDPTPEQAFHDRRIFVVCPTRNKLDPEVQESWNDLLWPQNAVHHLKFAKGWEVGQAYDTLVKVIRDSKDYGEFPYILTIEDDNLPPRDGVEKLLQVMESGPWDAVAGLYHTKDPRRTPLVLGDVEGYKKTGRQDFSPIDVSKIPQGQRTVEVLAVPMGFTLWRMSFFRDVPEPWYLTTQGMVGLGGGKYVSIEEFELLWHSGKIDRTKRYESPCYTQDVHACAKGLGLGKRYCVDLTCNVGHKDVKKGVIY